MSIEQRGTCPNPCYQNHAPHAAQFFNPERVGQFPAALYVMESCRLQSIMIAQLINFGHNLKSEMRDAGNGKVNGIGADMDNRLSQIRTCELLIVLCGNLFLVQFQTVYSSVITAIIRRAFVLLIYFSVLILITCWIPSSRNAFQSSAFL